MEIQGRNTNDEVAIGWRRPYYGEAHIVHAPIRNMTDIELFLASVWRHTHYHYHTDEEQREVDSFARDFIGGLKTAYGIGIEHLK